MPEPRKEPQTETLRFLPWLRRGIALTITETDDGQSDLPRSAPLDAYIDLNGQRATAPIALRPADHVSGISSSMIVRRYPAPSAGEAEYGYFPLVEVATPDLPWVVTPAGPGSSGFLRPWVVLVCVVAAEADYISGSEDRPARLIVAGSELPHPSEMWAWAHVQSAVELDDVAAAVADQPGAVIARLVCPRRLLPGTEYRAALVNAFKVDNDGTMLQPAWSTAEQADLTVYESWTFTTGQAGSFEELCERLGPIDDPKLRLGITPMAVDDLGPIGQWPKETPDDETVVDYSGAIWDVGVEPQPLGPSAKIHFEAEVVELLNQGDIRPELRPDAPDPVVTVPFHGAYALGRHTVPDEGWAREVNVEPIWRAAAGLGALVVRRNQERFMAMAWQQAGELRETNRQLSFARLQSEVGRTVKSRVDKLDSHQRVALTWHQLSFLRDDDGEPPRVLLTDSTIPSALVTTAYQRVMRPSGIVTKAAAKRVVDVATVNAAIGVTFGSTTQRAELQFGVPLEPAGTMHAHPVRDKYRPLPVDDPPGNQPPPGDIIIERPPTRGKSGFLSPRSPSRSTVNIVLGSPETLGLDDVAAVATQGIDPIGSARARTERRISALPQIFGLTGVPGDELPSRIKIGPMIEEALVWSLVELGSDLLMPGASAFPDNAVRMAIANPEFVASFLAGANTEMTEELVWREFPAQLGSTTFRRFWERPDRTATDIDPMETWLEKFELADLAGGEDETLVLLVRGDLIRHYPTVRILLRSPIDDDTGDTTEIMPSF
ncbi:MAG: hypothetical protein OEW83_01670, partial [Acidimicrobiia bacterium]|nr:hypothetical protein [Acidimicrobiia bacterium]